MNHLELDIVIPVYNEGKNIFETLEGLARHVGGKARVLLVHDSEEDNTLAPALAFANAHPELPIQPVKNRFGRGALNAIRTGFAASTSEYCLVCMGDASDDFAAINPMLEKIRNGYDLVCGSRYMKGGRQIGGLWFKVLLSRTAGLTLHWLGGLPTHDATNSFKMYRSSVLREISMQSTGGFEIGMELTVKAYLAGYRIGEVPSIWKDRSAGVSRFRLFRWLPNYLRWYFLGLTGRFSSWYRAAIKPA